MSRAGADVVVRVNQPLELCVRDFEAAISPAIKALLLPKVDSASHVRLLAELAERIEVAKGLPVGHNRFSILVETAEAFSRVDEIAKAHPCILAIGLGAEDFALSTSSVPEADILLYPKQRVAIAAHAAGILAMGIIGSVANFNNEAGIREAVSRSRRFGFSGSACIHLKVVPLLNEGFSPTDEEVGAAERVIAGFQEAKAQGRASITVDGKMIDCPIVERAERLLNLARRTRSLAAEAS
ncbi:HpcH/HpaI aldolase/citrate lyase family protein [Acuticoccus sp.]|uniref:HpcH/HpaI aldolase/citrate lyase family protein n=1 Tax=Acuticoccus sp. TaxID=1904378 RepID=UPI003B526E75